MISRQFAIGDIHGCSKTFEHLLFEKIGVRQTDEIFLLGDYIDRGPDSKGVVDLILQLQAEGYTLHTLRGNHEQMMLDSTQSGSDLLDWVINGGRETLASFGARRFNDLEPQYKTFFRRTKYFLETPRYIFVHAGLNFKFGDPLEDTDSMLWIRGFEVDLDWLGERRLIHGHTPIPLERILAQRDEPVIDLDGGCVHVYNPGMGHLVALDLNTLEFLPVACLDEIQPIEVEED